MKLCALGLLVLFSFSPLMAQDSPVAGTLPEMPETESPAVAETFPLALVLEAAEYAHEAGAWRPDWPLELPPDAFKVLSGGVSRVTLQGESVSLIFLFDAEGRPEEFPFMLNGSMAQVSLVYEGPETRARIREMTLAFPDSEEPWKLEFIAHNDSYPGLVRVSQGDVWYFISLSRGGNRIIETWYDEEGNILWAYGFSLTEIGKNMRIRAIWDFPDIDNTAGGTDRYHDSRGLLTETSGPGGVFRVLYFREDLPRYWERRPAEEDAGEAKGGVGNFSLQWDQRDFLLRITSETDDTDEPAEYRPVEYRYEYTLDERGNWIERREVQMIRRLGLLVPSPGTAFKRVLEYRPE